MKAKSIVLICSQILVYSISVLQIREQKVSDVKYITRDDKVGTALPLGVFSTEFHVLVLDWTMLSQRGSSLRKLMVLSSCDQ